ncbi:MFS transporter small subunit [Streptomyces sp. TE5632]
MERGADVGADGPGAENCHFHWGTLRSVEGVPRRWGRRPNSPYVDEILSTVWRWPRQGFAHAPRSGRRAARPSGFQETSRRTPGRKGFFGTFAWLWVGVPLACGLYELARKAARLFTG